MKRGQFVISLLGLVMALASYPITTSHAAGASLVFSPNQGDYLVNNTFDVSLVVNTGGQSINAVEAFVSFPADKLQVVSPSVTNSFISFWIAGPSYSNTDGTLTFQGGLPTPGINTSAGVISTVKFRAKSSGKVTVKYSETSKVLANDGSGTDLLTSRATANFEIKNPAPAGPIVTSSSHEDPNRWYNNRTINLAWEAPEALEYSYIFDTNPATVPDEQAETKETSLSKTLDQDGRWYFHIRARNTDGWGGTTHFHAKIDASPPAHFKPILDPKTISPDTRGILSFSTTDAMSGIDHYEVKLISENAASNDATFFVEQSSPYQLPKLAAGKYQLVVRAHDAAGNHTDETISYTVGGLNASFFGSLSPLLRLGLSLLALILLLIFIYLWSRRRKRAHEPMITETTKLKQVMQEKQAELSRLRQVATQTVQTIDSLPQPEVPSVENPNSGQGLPRQ